MITPRLRIIAPPPPSPRLKIDKNRPQPQQDENSFAFTVQPCSFFPLAKHSLN